MTAVKKEEKRQRNNRKTFRMNDEELTAFLLHCEAANLSGGDLFRVKCCKQKALKPSKRKRIENEAVLLKYLGQIGRIGNNVNQVAHAMNIAKFKPDAVACVHIIERHEETIQKLQITLDVILDLLTRELIGDDT